MLHIDIETYSETDLTKAGVYRYAEDPAFRVLLVGYARDGELVKVVDIEHGERLPESLVAAIFDPAATKCAHNANFERVCLARHYGRPLPPEQWRCTAAWARACGLPGSLGPLTQALTGGRYEIAAKDTAGAMLIQKFCVPGKRKQLTLDDTDWKAFVEYCRQDVAAEMSVHAYLSRYPLPAEEWATWALDQEINDDGLPIDMAVVRIMRDVEAGLRVHYEQQIRDIAGIDNPNSRDQLIGWLKDYSVYPDDLGAGAVAGILKQDIAPEARAVLAARQQLARSSLAKLEALERAVCRDNRMRGAFLYHGTGTGRWAGRIFQPQNLPRPTIKQAEIDTARGLIVQGATDLWAMLYPDPMGALSSLVRAVIASDKRLSVADLASIESVMAAWVAESHELVELFRAGRDPYKDFAVKLYGVKYEEVTKKQRSFCKPCVLGAQYGMSPSGLRKYAEAFGMDMSDHDARQQIGVWKRSYKAIPETWGRIQDAALSAVRHPGGVFTGGRCSFVRDEEFLRVALPSGRALHYRGAEETVARFGPEIAYTDPQKGTIRTFGARLFENIVQAVARDVLAAGLLQADAAGLRIVGHVHDEIITEGDNLPGLIKAMTTPPAWCADAPIRAEGYTAGYYRKD